MNAVLLRDDFSGGALDTGNWFVPAGAGTFLGRTQLRPPAAPPIVAGGHLRLQLDTYNPTALVAGDSFWGSEIVSQRTFTPAGNGLAFTTRVRLLDPVPGYVGAFFLYTVRGTNRDEIDVELLSTELPRGRLLTNVFRGEGLASAGSPMLVPVPAPAAGGFLDLEIEWRPGQIRWKVNSIVVREAVANVPEGPMSLRLNMWAPSDAFPEAYDPTLQPTAAPTTNRSFIYEVDFVEVRTIG